MTRLTFFLAICLVCVSCTSSNEPFVQDDIRIVPPVTQIKDPDGAPIVDAHKDGGTEMIRITDAKGKEFTIYFDYRLRESVDGEPLSRNTGTIYLNAYPDSQGSVRVIDQDLFRKQILKGIEH